MADVRLPSWADQWQSGRCGCGARLVRVECYCGGHVACSASSVDFQRCPRIPAPADPGAETAVGGE